MKRISSSHQRQIINILCAVIGVRQIHFSLKTLSFMVVTYSRCGERKFQGRAYIWRITTLQFVAIDVEHNESDRERKAKKRKEQEDARGEDESDPQKAYGVSSYQYLSNQYVSQ